VRAELSHALTELRLAAEALKSFDSDAADRLEVAIGTHAGALKTAELAKETAAQRDRILGACEAAVGAVARSRQYPSQITARADVLDRAATLAKMIRVIQGQFEKGAR
jgi:hypothetical protein